MWEITTELPFEQWNKHFTRRIWSSTRPDTRSCTRVRATSNIKNCWRNKGLRAPLWRMTWLFWWIKHWTWVKSVHSQPRRPTASVPASKEESHIRPTKEYPGALSTRQTWTWDLLEQAQRRSMKVIRRLEHLS